MQLLQHSATAANESDDFDAAIDTCVERVMMTTGWKVGLVWEPISEGSEEWGLLGRVFMSDGSMPTDSSKPAAPTISSPASLPLGRVRSTAKPEWASAAELEADPRPRAKGRARSWPPLCRRDPDFDSREP